MHRTFHTFPSSISTDLLLALSGKLNAGSYNLVTDKIWALSKSNAKQDEEEKYLKLLNFFKGCNCWPLPYKKKNCVAKNLFHLCITVKFYNKKKYLEKKYNMQTAKHLTTD